MIASTPRSAPSKVKRSDKIRSILLTLAYGGTSRTGLGVLYTEFLAKLKNI